MGLPDHWVLSEAYLRVDCEFPGVSFRISVVLAVVTSHVALI